MSYKDTVEYYGFNAEEQFNEYNKTFYEITNAAHLEQILENGFITSDFPPRLTNKYKSREYSNIENNIFLKDYHEKYKPFYFFDKNDADLKNNSSIHFFSTHGSIIEENLENADTRVPQDTLICFTNPISVLGTKLNDNDSFFYNPVELSLEKYCNLFKYRNHLRYLPDNNYLYTTDITKTFKYDYIFTSFLKNSVWYYPGQAYPEMRLSVSEKDYKGIQEGYSQHEYEYQYLDDSIQCIESPFFGLDSSDILLDNPNKKFNIKLSDYVKKIVTDKYQIIFITSCRGIEDTTKINDFLKYEKFILNLNLYSEINQGICKQIVQTLSSKLFPEINSITINNYYIIKNSKNIRIVKPDELYLDYKAPHIFDIYKKIEDDSTTTINRDDINYLNLLNPKELLYFFYKLKTKKPDGKFKKLLKYFFKQIKIKLEAHYEELISNIRKNFQDPILMCYKKKGEINTDLLVEIIEIIQFFQSQGYMKSINLTYYKGLLKPVKLKSNELNIFTKEEIIKINPTLETLRIFTNITIIEFNRVKTCSRLQFLELNQKYQPINIELKFDIIFPNLNTLIIHHLKLDTLSCLLIPNIRIIKLSKISKLKLENLSSLNHLEELTLIDCDIQDLLIIKNLKILLIDQMENITLNIKATINSLILKNISPESIINYDGIVNMVKYYNTVYNKTLFQGSNVSSIKIVTLNCLEFITTSFEIYKLNPDKLTVTVYYLQPFFDIINSETFTNLKKLYIECYEPSVINFNFAYLNKLVSVNIKGENISYPNLNGSHKKIILRKNKFNRLE